jgi:hypothetical protein
MAVLGTDAAGLGGFTNTPLAQLYLYDKIMDRYFERDFLKEITNSEISERITSCTQEVQIIKAIDVGAWNPYVVGQEMVHSSITPTALKLSICYAAYLAFKLDEYTLHFTCNWDRIEDKLLESSYERFVELQRNFVFSELIAYAAPQNQGNGAGRYGEYKLGAQGAPIHITPSTVVQLLANLQNVLAESVHFVENQMFLIAPLQLRPVIMYSDFANQAWTGGSGLSTAIDGRWPHPLNGFTVYETMHLPSFYDNGHQCHYMIAGHKDAYAYAADVIGERVTTGENSWSIKYQMLAAWGGAMLYPEFVAIAYGYFDTEKSL